MGKKIEEEIPFPDIDLFNMHPDKIYEILKDFDQEKAVAQFQKKLEREKKNKPDSRKPEFLKKAKDYTNTLSSNATSDEFIMASDYLTTFKAKRMISQSGFKEGLFCTFSDKEQEVLESTGIDGVVSAPITVKKFYKFMYKLGYDPLKSLQMLPIDFPLYQSLKRRFSGQGLLPKEDEPPLALARLCLHEHVKPNTLKDCLFVVFHDAKLHKLCRERKKKYGTYCYFSIQGLNQPTRLIHNTLLKALHYMLKNINVDRIDIASDVRKVSKISKYVDTFKETMTDVLDSRIDVLSPKFVGDIEKSCYFNVASRERELSTIKFYNKFHKEYHDKNHKDLDDTFATWYRIEAVIRFDNTRFSKNKEKFLLAVTKYLKILEFSGIMPGVKVDINSMGLLNAQLNAIKSMKKAEETVILPDDTVFSFSKNNAKSKIIENNAEGKEIFKYAFVNRIAFFSTE